MHKDSFMKKKEVPEVSIKNTKDQILAAYTEVLSKLEDQQPENPQDKKEKEDQGHLISRIATHSSESLLNDFAALKLKTMKQIDGLSEELLSEFRVLSEIRQAITVEQKHLQELYQIKETAHTLTALIQTQAREKEKFEEEIAFKKGEWTKQMEQLEGDFQEKKEALEKTRKREEEEYAYAQDIARRKDMDDFEARKQALEKELSGLKEILSQKEADIMAKEEEFISLRERVENIPTEVSQAVKEAEERLRQQLEQQFTFAKDIREKDIERDQKLSEQKIIHLEAKILTQEQFIRELSQKADGATQQVQEIACRALEASAQRFHYPFSFEEKEGAVALRSEKR